GGDWAKLAREWLSLHGVSVPEHKEAAQFKFKIAKVPVSQAVSNQQAKKQQTKAEWLAEQRVERDRKAYAQIAQMIGVEAAINTNSDDYKDQAREVLYQPLKKHLKYETHGELISGFAEEMKPTDGRSLLAYDCSQGTGKSNNALIPPALQVAKDGGRVLIIVPTRGLAKEFKGRINERAGDGIAATHLDEKYYSASVVVTCPESAYKFKGQKFDLIQIDEANEGSHRIESAELGNAGPQSLAAYRKLLPMAQTVAIATAAMSGWTLAAVQTIGGFTPEETQLQRRVRPATEMRITEYSNFYQWLQQIINALRSGKRVSIPTGSQGKGRAIDRVLRALFPEKGGVVMDGKATIDNLRKQFLASPDDFLSGKRAKQDGSHDPAAYLVGKQPDWFIFSPVINSGVSIEGQHFDIQFEYVTPHEGAQSASQRGERVRSAIGRDGAITERHVYFSQQGAPTLEAYPDALSWQYWADALTDEANAPVGAAAALAKALGATKALKPIEQEAEKFAAMRPNLPHFLALKAFEIIFKKELLHEDWQRYGWQVSQAAKPDGIEAKQIAELESLVQSVRIGLIRQQGRTFKKTRTREAEGEIEEISNTFQAARAAKFQLERLIGKGYLSQQDDGFFTAWAADKSADNPGVRAVVRSQLLAIAVSDPDCWQQIEQMKALKFLAGKPDADSDLFWSLPELPAAARDIELAGIIARCPGVAEVVSGKMQQWTNKDPQIIAAGLYLIAHSKQIAVNTKRTGLVRGAKFSEQMTPAALFNKALELMGYKPAKDKRQGSGARLNEYRLEAEADVAEALTEMKAEEKPDAMKLFRAELKAIRAQSRQSINAAAKSQILSKALAWVSEQMGAQVGKAIAAIKQRHAVLIDSGLSKLGDAAQMSAANLPDSINQMALIQAGNAAPPPIPLNS
ncbi:MAG: DEAD/DEAH box helicase family protein, partial [Phormidesmis sp.]